MRILVKNQNNEVFIFTSINGAIPAGLVKVPDEDLVAAELTIARANKLSEIRARRDLMLSKNDKLWIIASKKGDSTLGLEADAQTLRDLPELAQTELDELSSVENIQSYDCFSGLALTGDYE